MTRRERRWHRTRREPAPVPVPALAAMLAGLAAVAAELLSELV